MTQISMQALEPEDVVGAREAAEILKVDRSTVTRMVARGELTPRLRLGSALVFSRIDIDAEAAARALTKDAS